MADAACKPRGGRWRIGYHRVAMLSRFLIIPAVCLAAATFLAAQPAAYNIRTVAGNYELGDSGPALDAFILNPTRVATDSSGNIYVAELLGRIRRIGQDGTINTIIGNPNATALGDGGPAAQASLNVVFGLAFDNSGNLYIAEFQGCRIRRVNLGSSIITTYAGDGVCRLGLDGPAATTSFNFPNSLLIDSQGRVVVSESQGNRIRRIDSNGMITTIAGNGTAGLSGDGGPASQARIANPGGLTQDSRGNLFFTDATNCVVREIESATGNIRTIAGTTCGYSGDGGPALSARLNPDQALVNATGNLLYVTESTRIRQINLDTHQITTYAGTGTRGYNGDGGPANQAQLVSVTSLAFDKDGSLLLVDPNRVRRIDSSGNISAAAGRDTHGGDGGPAISASLANPTFVASDGKGGFAIADLSNGRIRAVSAGGVMSTLAGIEPYTGSAGDGGLAKDATLGFVRGIAYDTVGNLYFTEVAGKLRRVSASGAINRVGTTNLAFPAGVAADPTQRFVYVAEATGHRIIRMDLTTGSATTFAGQGTAGSPGTGGFGGDLGPANQALLSSPGALAVDGRGNLYVLDGGNARIRRISPSGDLIQTVAGNGTPGSTGDGGLATAARIGAAYIASDADGNLFLSEGNKTRRVDVRSGLISTIAGGNTNGFSGDSGPALSAQFGQAQGLSVDSQGNIYVADQGNHRIRELTDANAVSITSVGSAGGFPDIAQNAWIEIHGTGLAPASVGPNGMDWGSAPEFASGRMPTQLNGVSVKVNGKPAYVYFISTTQVNVLTPLDDALGPVQIVVTNGTSSSPAFTVNMGAAAPSFIPLTGGKYVLARHADLSLLGPTSLSSDGYPFTPAQPGETIIFYAFGFGLPTTPLVGGSATQSGSLPALPVIQIGDSAATVLSADVISPGLYQFNVIVPLSAPSGDNALTASYGGLTTPSGTVLAVQ